MTQDLPPCPPLPSQGGDLFDSQGPLQQESVRTRWECCWSVRPLLLCVHSSSQAVSPFLGEGSLTGPCLPTGRPCQVPRPRPVWQRLTWGKTAQQPPTQAAKPRIPAKCPELQRVRGCAQGALLGPSAADSLLGTTHPRGQRTAFRAEGPRWKLTPNHVSTSPRSEPHCKEPASSEHASGSTVNSMEGKQT